MRKREILIENLKRQIQDIVKDPMLREQRTHCLMHREIAANTSNAISNQEESTRIDILEDENAKMRVLLMRTFKDLREAIDPVAPDETYHLYDLSAVPLDWIIEELASDLKHCTDLAAEIIEMAAQQQQFENCNSFEQEKDQ